jgi:hypothetical protein
VLYYIAICGLSCSIIFFHIISYKAGFWGQIYWILNAYFDFFNICMKNHSKNNSLRYDYKCTYILHVIYPLFLSDFDESLIFWDFQEVLIYKISWKSVQWEPIYSMKTDIWIDMKLIVTFNNFVNMPKNWCALHQQITLFLSVSLFWYHILCILVLCTH